MRLFLSHSYVAAEGKVRAGRLLLCQKSKISSVRPFTRGGSHGRMNFRRRPDIRGYRESVINFGQQNRPHFQMM